MSMSVASALVSICASRAMTAATTTTPKRRATRSDGPVGSQSTMEAVRVVLREAKFGLFRALPCRA